MSLRLPWYSVCLMVLGCAITAPKTGNTSLQTEAPPCTPGELLFAPSYLPLDLVPTPDGRSLVVVDRGFLALREATTLKVQRYLLPQVDGWVAASFSPDGRTLTAQTFDGQRYAFDTSTWKSERLVDARVSRLEREKADEALIHVGPTELWGLSRESSQRMTDLLREPALVQELGKQRMFPVALAQNELRQQLLIAEDSGALTLVDLAGQRIIQRIPCDGCSPYVYLRAEAEGFLGVTEAGQLRVLDRDLKVGREVSFLSSPCSQDAREAGGARGAACPRLMRQLMRVGDGSRIVWLTRDHEMGLVDIGTGTNVVRLSPLGLGGATMAALLDARRLALVSEGTLRVWDMPEQRVLLEKQGPYSSAVRLDAERVIVTRDDGSAEVLSTRSGEVLRRCATPRLCGSYSKERAPVLPISAQAKGEERLYSGGALTVRVHPAPRQDGFYDEVVLFGAGERPLGVLAERRLESRRGQLRRETFADVLPSGERFLVAGGTWEEDSRFGALRFHLGSTQVWCSPRETPLPRVPEAPPLPEVMEIDGLTEVSLAAVSGQYDAIAATEDGTAYLLATTLDPNSGPSGPPTLWRLTPGSPRAERLELPPAPTSWARMATAPDDGSLWVVGEDALAHREAEGQWTVHPLPAGGGLLRDFLALPGRQAVVLRIGSDMQRPDEIQLQFVIAGPGPALVVTNHSGGGGWSKLVPLPDGFMFLGTQAGVFAPGGSHPATLVPGFRFREGKWLEKDALLERVRALHPYGVWLREGRLLMDVEAPFNTSAWMELDARTGKVLKPQQALEQFYSTPGNAERLDVLASRAALTPQASDEADEDELSDASRWEEPPQWVDHQGKVLGNPSRFIPPWLRVFSRIQEAVSTKKGTWLRLESNVLLFWDGARLSAYFHPDTRQHWLKRAQ